MSIRSQLYSKSRFAIVAILPLLLANCSSSTSTPTPAPATYVVTYLTADAAGSSATSVDPLLLNPWGLCFDQSNSVLWAADNHGGFATDYDTSSGVIDGGKITVLNSNQTPGGSPSGLIAGPTTHPFVIPSKGAAIFLFATEDGTVGAWNNNIGSQPAVTVLNHTLNGAVYKGLAYLSSNSGSSNNLWVANFHSNLVELYDPSFAPGAIYTTTAKAPGLAPFNITNIGGKMFVACARPKMPAANGSVDDSAGAGIGAVVTFDGTNSTPTLFATGGTLNSPWGMAKAPANFGKYSNDILVGNFGDGKINVYDNNGNYQGQLQDASGSVIVIDGLWSLLPSPSANSGRVYFTAGPNHEANGRLGFIDLKR